MYKNKFPVITDEDTKLPFYITSIGSDDNQANMERPEGYPSYHWLYCVQGKGMLVIDGNEYVISENMGFIFIPGITHKYYALTDSWETRWITFDGYAVSRLLKQLHIVGRYNVYNIINPIKLEKLYSDIFNSADSLNSLKSSECSYLLYRFLLEFNSCVNNSIEKLKKEKRFRLEPVIVYMQKNYNRNLSLEDLSTLISVTPQHTCRLFKQAYNMRPFEYLTGIRIQKSKEFLTGSCKLKLEEIAGYSGYNDTSYFCTVFKEHEGVTPVEFKKLHGKG